MAGLLDDWLYTKDENQETAPERLQPLWGGLIKAGLLSVAGGGNLMPEQRAQYVAKAGEALGDIPTQMLARKSDIAKQKLQTLQGEHMKSQIASEAQKRDQQAKMDALTSDPEFMKKLQAGDQSARIALGQIALQAGHYDTAMKALMPEKIISLGGGDFYNSETKQVYDHYTGEYRSPKPGEVPGAPPATQGSPPVQPPAVVPPTDTAPAVTAPAVTPPLVTPPIAAPPVVPAPPPVMPPVGGPPLPPYQQPYTGLRNDPIAPGILPQFQGGAAQGPLPGGLPSFQAPGLGMSNPPPPPPPSLAPPPVAPPVMPPPSAPAPGPVPVPPTAGGPAPPPVVSAAAPPVITPQPVVTPPQGSNDQAMIDRARNAPVDPGAARELGGQPPGRPKIFVNGKAIDVPMPRNPNINVQALARVPEKARPIVMGLIDGNIGFGDLRGMKDKDRYLKDAIAVDPTLSNTTNAQRNVWMKQLALSSPGTPGGLISNANTFLLHAGELEDKADKLNLDNNFKANLSNPLEIAKMKANRDPRLTAYENIVNPVLREFTNVMVGSHITDKEIEPYRQMLYAAQTPQERHAALATMTSLMKDRLIETVAQRHEQIMGTPAGPNQFLFPKQRAAADRFEALAAKDAEDRAKAAAAQPGGGGGGRPGTRQTPAGVRKFNPDTGKLE